MKRLTLIFALFMASIASNAQSRMDTVIVGTDTIIKPIGAILVEPRIVNAKGDTAYSMDFMALNVASDTLTGCNSYVSLRDKKGNVVADFNQDIPASVLNQWGEDPAPVFDYILSQNPRFRRYTLRK